MNTAWTKGQREKERWRDEKRMLNTIPRCFWMRKLVNAMMKTCISNMEKCVSKWRGTKNGVLFSLNMDINYITHRIGVCMCTLYSHFCVRCVFRFAFASCRWNQRISSKAHTMNLETSMKSCKQIATKIRRKAEWKNGIPKWLEEAFSGEHNDVELTRKSQLYNKSAAIKPSANETDAF